MITNETKTEEETRTQHKIEVLSKAISSWYVRRDSKFYDVNRLNTPLSKEDIERACIIRIRGGYEHFDITPDLIKAVFNRAIVQMIGNPEQSIPVWNGSQVCSPDVLERVVWKDGTVAVNTWTQPSYRSLRVNEAELGVAAEFFEAMFAREAEREMVLNWLAWCLQNEADKPMWAPFFYSRSKGTGKSTLCMLVGKLFGDENTVTQNSIEKLTAQFNMSVLQSKLVISEEVQLNPNTAQGNRLKTYITEPQTLAEKKGREAELVKQCCSFLFTSNHLPLWIEPADRRIYICDVDHDGHSSGPRAAEFSELVGRLREAMEDPVEVAKMYNALVARRLPDTFSPKSLNITRDSTPIMKRIHESSRLVTLDQLDEYFDELSWNAVSESLVVTFIKTRLGGTTNQTKHLMSELGWEKQKAKWDGVDYSRAIWVRPGYAVHNGRIVKPDGTTEPIPNGNEFRESV